MEINIQEHFPILKTFTKSTDRICLTKKELNLTISTIITEVLKEAADSAELIYYCCKKYKSDCNAMFCRNCIETINKESITFTINKVKF